jgi:hypothetical protein
MKVIYENLIHFSLRNLIVDLDIHMMILDGQIWGERFTRVGRHRDDETIRQDV